MSKTLTTLTITLMFLSLGQVTGQQPCPCQPDMDGPAETTNGTAPGPEERDTGDVCPIYVYASHNGYCSWYAQKCGFGPVSIDLPCNHGPGNCSNPVNCVQVPAGRNAAPADAVPGSVMAAMPKPAVNLKAKPNKDYGPKFTVSFAQLQSVHSVKIQFHADKPPIYARINVVSLPAITTADGMIIPGGTVMHGYEVKQFNDTPDKEFAPDEVFLMSSHPTELRVNEFSGQEVWITTNKNLQN